MLPLGVDARLHAVARGRDRNSCRGVPCTAATSYDAVIDSLEAKMPRKAKRAKRASGKRELIDTGRDKRYVRRGAKGRFKESDDVGRSLSADRRRKAKKKVQSGYGDRGDR
jgi:hypothetical protein